MTRPNAPKKSETLEVRLPFETKTAFMAWCHASGRTASEQVRAFIELELKGPARRAARTRVRWWHALAAAAAGLAIGAVAAPSLAHPAGSSRAMFDQLDRNGDGFLSLREFQASAHR